MTFRSRLNLDEWVQSSVDGATMKVVQATKDAWNNEAKAKLNTTYPDYAKAITAKVSLGSTPRAEVYLKGAWANKLESGFAPYDMKSSMARSRKAKTSIEDTWYLTIPFNYSTSSATGKTGARLPRSVYNAARKLPSWGKLTSATKAGGWGQYEGLVKTPTNDKGTKHSYTNFRTVSENSPSSAFRHPGFEGVHIADSLREQIPDTFRDVLLENLKYRK